MGNNAPELARMLKKGTDVDDVKHLADSLDVLAKALDAQGQFSPFARIHALKFYDLQAPRLPVPCGTRPCRSVHTQ